MGQRHPAIKPVLNDFGGLFNDCATRCELYLACGGKSTAPCGCAWPSSSGLRYKCDQCPILCRERKTKGINGLENDFLNHLATGRQLGQVSLQQNKSLIYPLFVPMLTNVYRGTVLPIRWAAADLDILYKRRKNKKAALKSHFDTAQSARAYLNVSSECQLWSILNGKDSYLESLWGLGKPERQQTFQHLLEIGFSVGTSATYSVSDLAIVKVNGKKITTPMPQTHNIYMLRRHNQVLHELQSSGFYSVPNLYWLEEDKLELNRWAKWLRDNPEIQSISRDFSSTRNRATVTNKLEELVYLLGAAGRSFHVIIVGTGVTNALIALKMLVSHGHTVTIVTSTPIYDARKCARRYEVENLGISRVPDRITPHSELILNNIVQFESLLRETALTISSQYNFLPNSL